MDCQATLSIAVTHCDPTSATTPLHWPAPATVHVSCPAKQLAPQQRRDLAIQVLARTETVSELARQHEVSRKFLYQQVHTAEAALSAAFARSSKADDVLFYLPVTKTWLRQLVLALGSPQKLIYQIVVFLAKQFPFSRRASRTFTSRMGPWSKN